MYKIMAGIVVVLCGMTFCGCSIFEAIGNDLDPFRVENSTPGVEMVLKTDS